MVFVVLCVVGVAVCDPSWMGNKMKYFEHEHDKAKKADEKDDGKANDIDSNVDKNEKDFRTNVDKDNNMFRSNVDLDQFMTKRGKDDYDGVPPFDDNDRMKSFTLNDEELAKRGANGKP